MGPLSIQETYFTKKLVPKQVEVTITLFVDEQGTIFEDSNNERRAHALVQGDINKIVNSHNDDQQALDVGKVLSSYFKGVIRSYG